VEAQHVEQVDGDERRPYGRHHGHVPGHEAEVADVDAVAVTRPVEGALFEQGEEVRATGLEAAPGAEEEDAAVAVAGALPATVAATGDMLVDAGGERAPDELVGQAFLA